MEPDGKEYDNEEFMRRYGLIKGEELWDRSQPLEKRRFHDGEVYSRLEFLQIHGGRLGPVLWDKNCERVDLSKEEELLVVSHKEFIDNLHQLEKPATQLALMRIEKRVSDVLETLSFKNERKQRLSGNRFKCNL